MRGVIPPLPQYLFMAWCLVNHRDNFAFPFPFSFSRFAYRESTPYKISHNLTKSRDSSVGIATGYGLDDRSSRVRFPAWAGNFSHHFIQNGSGAHQTSYPMDTRVFSHGVNRPGLEAHHSPPASAEVSGAVLPLPQCAFMAWCLFKHRENFISRRIKFSR
jgi:hypothetical protein